MKFTSKRYPQLRVKVPGGAAVAFTDGQVEVGDAAAVEALLALPAGYEVEAVEEHDEKGADDHPPAKTAAKAAWVDYAVDVHGLDRGEAEGLTKADLVELYGG